MDSFFHEGTWGNSSSSFWPQWERMLQENDLGTLTCAVCVWKGQEPRLMFAESRARVSGGTEQIEQWKSPFSEGEDGGEGKCGQQEPPGSHLKRNLIQENCLEGPCHLTRRLDPLSPKAESARGVARDQELEVPT